MKHLLLPLGALALRAYGMSYHMGCPATPQVGGEGCKRELQGVVRSYRDKRHNREAPRSNSNFLVSMDWFQEPLQVPKSMDVCFLHEMVDKGPSVFAPRVLIFPGQVPEMSGKFSMSPTPSAFRWQSHEPSRLRSAQLSPVSQTWGKNKSVTVLSH